MPKSSTEPVTARSVKKPKKTQQFTVILTGPLARALHTLAENQGQAAGAMFRQWIREKFSEKFGKEVA